MKYFAFFSGVIVFALVSIVLITNYSFNSSKLSSSAIPAPNSSVTDKMESITHDQSIYYFSWEKIDNLNNLKLFPNFTNKANSKQLIKDNNCQVLVSGGFYDEVGKPIGWLVSQNDTISEAQDNSFFNGFLNYDRFSATISTHPPEKNIISGLQSGPLLVADRKPLPLLIREDESRRRVVATTNYEGKLIFLIILGKDTLLDGPKLTGLPEIIIKIGERIGENFTSAINLDGGSASSFYTKDIYIKEMSWFGSYFCLADE